MVFTLIAVHGGAGNHSIDHEVPVKHTLRQACKQALQSLEIGQRALPAVETAISVLEDAECLNAGYGSNLTLRGTVECDAAIMDGISGAFGSVGAVSGVRRPITLARAILENGQRTDSLGRVPPLTLVGEGALDFYKSLGNSGVPQSQMVCPRAKREWEYWTERLRVVEESQQSGVSHGAIRELGQVPQDTVGAVACDNDSFMAAGVSSGGVLLKCPGRLGEAAVYGAGCLAESVPTKPEGLAISISGNGEQIIRLHLAQRIADAFHDYTLGEPDTHSILESIFHQAFKEPTCEGVEVNLGVLLLTKEIAVDGHTIYRLWCAFTTESMAVGYASTLDPKPKALILRRTPSAKYSGRHSDRIFITTLPLARV